MIPSVSLSKVVLSQLNISAAHVAVILRSLFNLFLQIHAMYNINEVEDTSKLSLETVRTLFTSLVVY